MKSHSWNHLDSESDSWLFFRLVGKWNTVLCKIVLMRILWPWTWSTISTFGLPHPMRTVDAVSPGKSGRVFFAAIGTSKMFKVSFLSHWVIESLKEWFPILGLGALVSAWTLDRQPCDPWDHWGPLGWQEPLPWTAPIGVTTPLLHQVARWVSPADFPGTWDGSEPQRTEIGHHFSTILLFYLFWGLLHPNKN